MTVRAWSRVLDICETPQGRAIAERGLERALERIRRRPGFEDATLPEIADAIRRGTIDPEHGHPLAALDELAAAGGLP